MNPFKDQEKFMVACGQSVDKFNNSQYNLYINLIAEETAEAIRAAMEGIDLLDVPLIADVKIVQKWGEAK